MNGRRLKFRKSATLSFQVSFMIFNYSSVMVFKLHIWICNIYIYIYSIAKSLL